MDDWYSMNLTHSGVLKASAGYLISLHTNAHMKHVLCNERFSHGTIYCQSIIFWVLLPIKSKLGIKKRLHTLQCEVHLHIGKHTVQSTATVFGTMAFKISIILNSCVHYFVGYTFSTNVSLLILYPLLQTLDSGSFYKLRMRIEEQVKCFKAGITRTVLDSLYIPPIVCHHCNWSGAVTHANVFSRLYPITISCIMAMLRYSLP